MRNDSTAYRDDYISVTKSTKFPLAFYNTRRVEDKPVADRLLEIWPNIVKTVKYWTSLLKSKQPKCKSFDIVSKAVNDVLTPLKSSFFIYMVSLFHPFLKKCQSELPLIPFLYDDLTEALKKVFQILIQNEKIDCYGKDLSQINLNEKSNLKSSKQFHLGLATEVILKELKSKDIVSRNDFQKFYEMVSKCVKTATSKLFEKYSLNSVIMRNSAVFLLPLIHAEHKLSLMKMMKGLTQQLHMLGISITNIVHNTYDQYKDFIKSNFDSISYKNGDCLDDLLFQTLKIERFPELSQITMIIFVINQGQAHVERGLSINTNVININMKEQSIRTKRLVRDHMQKYNLQPATTEITNLLKKSCSPAYQR